MPIPDYQSVMLSLLRLAGDGKEHRFRDAIEKLAAEFQITDAERAELLPSGTAPLFDNRVGWARTYLKQAGLIRSPKRGIFHITDQRKKLLSENPPKIDTSFLNRYEGFREFRSRRRDRTEADATNNHTETEAITDQPPEDALADAYQKLRKNLEGEVLDQIKTASPTFFERLVIDLLVSMGYGGSRQDAGRALGRSGDGGIDGISEVSTRIAGGLR